MAGADLWHMLATVHKVESLTKLYPVGFLHSGIIVKKFVLDDTHHNLGLSQLFLTISWQRHEPAGVLVPSKVIPNSSGFFYFRSPIIILDPN